jgi:hypothetical protein
MCAATTNGGGSTASVQRVAQIDGWELGIHAAEVAEVVNP